LVTASSIVTSNLFILQEILSPTLSASAQQNREEQAEKIYAFRRERLEKLKPLFEQHSIPFSPEVFVKYDWRQRLAPVLESMPEMKMVRTAGRYLSGVYIANALILPEKAEAIDVTFILANHLIFEGSNPGLSGDLFIYPIKSDNVRRIKINLASDSPEEHTDDINEYLEWIFRYNGHPPSEMELPQTISLPKNAKKIRVIGSYVYFQVGFDKNIDK
jgi:hypothetical protein